MAWRKRSSGNPAPCRSCACAGHQKWNALPTKRRCRDHAAGLDGLGANLQHAAIDPDFLIPRRLHLMVRFGLHRLLSPVSTLRQLGRSRPNHSQTSTSRTRPSCSVSDGLATWRTAVRHCHPRPSPSVAAISAAFIMRLPPMCCASVGSGAISPSQANRPNGTAEHARIGGMEGHRRGSPSLQGSPAVRETQPRSTPLQ